MREDVENVLRQIPLPSAEDKRAYLAKLVSGMLTLPAVPGVESKRSLGLDEVVNAVNSYGFADWNQPLAWIRQDGFIMPTVDFRHEYVLHWLGLTSAIVEDQGWARISNSGWQCMYRVSAKQRKALVARGCVVESDAERLKRPWHGLPPYDDSVHPSKRIAR